MKSRLDKDWMLTGIKTCTVLWLFCSPGVKVCMASDSDCPRLPETDAVTVPLVVRGHELSQFLLDLRTTQIIQWKSVAIISDDTIGACIIHPAISAMYTLVVKNELFLAPRGLGIFAGIKMLYFVQSNNFELCCVALHRRTVILCMRIRRLN